MYKYKEYVKKNWYCFILGPLFMVLEASGEFILPYINANIINIGASTGNISYIIQNGAYMFAIALFMLVTGVLGAYFAIRGSARMAAGVRKDTFNKIQTYAFEDIDEFSTGSLITRITNDITQIQTFTATLLRGFFRSPVMLIGAVVMSYRMNKSLAHIIMIIIPLLAMFIALIIYIASPRYTRMQKSIDALNNNIEETVTNQRVIKSFVREEYEENKFNHVNTDLRDKSIKALKMMIFMQPLTALAINIATLCVVWVAGKQIMVGTMEIGTLTAFITYLSQVLNALNFLANIFLQGTRAAASDRRISEVLERKVMLNDDHAKYKELEVQNGNIRFEDVSFRYFKQNRELVLNHINCEIPAGEFVGIIGSTGSGKSTFISMISRLYDPDTGNIYLDDINVKDYSLYHLRESVSVVLQNNTLFSGTIRENLQWGNEHATDKEIEKACKIACCDEFIRNFEDGYDTFVAQGGNNFSGGQKQRLCIARALLKNPKILILDDSTSAVDTATDAKIRKSFYRDLKGMTKIVIAQRISSVLDADRIIVLDEGKIVGNGKHEQLIHTCKAYQEIYYSQKDKEEA